MWSHSLSNNRRLCRSGRELMLLAHPLTRIRVARKQFLLTLSAHGLDEDDPDVASDHLDAVAARRAAVHCEDASGGRRGGIALGDLGQIGRASWRGRV